MRTGWHDIWGRAHGPVSRLAPPTRLVAGGLVFLACLVSAPTGAAGTLLLFGLTAAWLGATAPPLRLLLGLVALGLSLFGPYLLLALLLHEGPADDVGSWSRALAAPWSVVAHGLAGMLVSVTTVATLDAVDLREGLLRLPLPRSVTAILLQVVHQSAPLLYETRQIGAAMALRGATRGGRAAWRVLFSLPSVWLPRVVARAERLAASIELRGFHEEDAQATREHPRGAADTLALVLALAALVATLGHRFGALS